MKLKLFIGVILVIGLAASGAWADLLSTPGLTITNGDKTFSNFTCNIISSGGGIPLACSQVTVVADTDPVTGNLGIEFQGFFQAQCFSCAFPYTSDDVKITYVVTAPSKLITDVHMFYDGSQWGTGTSVVDEEVFSGSTVVGNITVTDPPPSFTAGTVLTGGPYTSVSVVKDIGLSSGPDGGASLSDIGQYFSQTVPEPASILLFGTLLLGCGSLLRKRA